MKRNIKLVLSDLDGTIIDADNRCHLKTVDAVKAIHQQGVYFGVCSGRPIGAIEPLLKEWQLDCDLIVGNNGAEYKGFGYCETSDAVLDRAVYRELCLKAEELNLAIGIYGDGNEILFSDACALRTAIICHRVGAKKGHLNWREVDYPISKLLYAGEPSEIEKLSHGNTFKDERYQAFQTAVDLFEFYNPLLSKACVFPWLNIKTGIKSEEVVAFGDTGNDIPMLKEAGVAVAMSNGSLAAKNEADEIAESVDKDGFAKMIYAHLKEGQWDNEYPE